MGKTVRVEDEVYEGMNRIRDWRETFSQVIGSLLKIREAVYNVRELVDPAHYHRERQRDQSSAAADPKR